MTHSTFVTDAEMSTYINLGVQELYDLFAEAMGQEFFLKTYEITLAPPTNVYDLPDDFHLLRGVDYSDSPFPTRVFSDGAGGTYTHDVPIEEKQDAYPILPYMFFERHSLRDTEESRLRRPNMRFRVFTEMVTTLITSGMEIISTSTDPFHRIRFTPVCSGYVLVWYIPIAPTLSEDEDIVTGFHGYEEYPALYAAQRALIKEESDPSGVTAMLLSMQARIRTMAGVRDVGHPERVQDFQGRS
jgi:hypothetical protein